MIPNIFPKLLVAASRERILIKNEVLFQPKDSVDSLFYTMEGEIFALRYQLDGTPAIMMRSFAGEIFAPASMNMTCYPCSAVAAIKSKVLQIPKTVFIEHLGKNPEFSRYFIDSLSTDLKKQCVRSERLRLKSVKDRILHFITCESTSGTEIILSCPISKWAEELGIEAESLYRTLSRMEKDGVIQRNKRHIQITP